MNITRPEPGSLYDIIYQHARTSIYVFPSKWTDLHSRLLCIRFIEHPAIINPVPTTTKPPTPSKEEKTLTRELDALESSADRACGDESIAIKHVISMFFPSLSRAETDASLDLYFGERVFRKAVYLSCLWKSHRSTDTSLLSASLHQIPRYDREPSTEYAPILAYVSRSQLAALRKQHHVAFRPGNTPNEAVDRLKRLRSKKLIPANADRDPYIVSILLAMAQAYYYGDRQSSLTPALFHNIKMRVITHEGNGDAANFVVYTAVVTETFLTRFMMPHRGPVSRDGTTGMEISYIRVRVWPLLGLKERLANALGSVITGHPVANDPDQISLWSPLVEPQPAYKLGYFEGLPGGSDSRTGTSAAKRATKKPPEWIKVSGEDNSWDGSGDEIGLGKGATTQTHSLPTPSLSRTLARKKRPRATDANEEVEDTRPSKMRSKIIITPIPNAAGLSAADTGILRHSSPQEAQRSSQHTYPTHHCRTQPLLRP